MDIKHLQYFIEVAKTNSFSKAAENLYITQPTISKMIKNLESELGVPLFDRSHKKLVLTDAGEVLLEQALLIDKAFNNMYTALQDLVELKTGHIRIGLPPIFNTKLFPKWIALFHKKYPDITFQLVEDGSKKIEEAVETGQLDIGIVVLPTDNKLFHSLPFLKEDLKLVIHHSHPLAAREEIQLSELRNEPFILFNKDFVLNDRIISACIGVGFEPHVISESSQWPFIEEMVAEKLGVSLLPESICKQLGNEVKTIKIVNPSIHWHLAIIWAKNHYLSYAAREWLRFAKKMLQQETEMQPLHHASL